MTHESSRLWKSSIGSSYTTSLFALSGMKVEKECINKMRKTLQGYRCGRSERDATSSKVLPWSASQTLSEAGEKIEPQQAHHRKWRKILCSQLRRNRWIFVPFYGARELLIGWWLNWTIKETSLQAITPQRSLNQKKCQRFQKQAGAAGSWDNQDVAGRGTSKCREETTT